MQVEHLEAHGHLAGLDLGHVEDVVDDRQQVLARGVDVADVFGVALVAKGAEQLGHHHLGEAVDGVQRGAQFVAHVGQELALGLVGALGADLLDLVLAGEFGQLVLAALQPVDGAFQRRFLLLHRGDVGGGDHHAALGGGAFRGLDPAAVAQLRLIDVLGA